MDAAERLRCERECTRLCYDFAWSVDGHRYDTFVALFAEDGVLDRAGSLSRGHAGIRAFLDGRPAGRITRHSCSNVRIDMTSTNAARGSSLALMYQANSVSGMPAPFLVSPPTVVDYEDHYTLTAAGWKFSQRRVSVIFQP